MLVKLNVDNHITGKEDELKGHLNGIFRLMSTTLNYKEWVTSTFHTGFPGKPDQSWLTPDVKKNTHEHKKHTST